MNTGTLVFRTDATARIGSGHLMRCLALAQSWYTSGEEVLFVISSDTSPFESRIIKEGFGVAYTEGISGSRQDALSTTQIAESVHARYVVIDGYCFLDDFHASIKQNRMHTLTIDDTGLLKYYNTDIVLNQNIYATMDLYPNHNPDTRFLLGLKYLLLRKEFLSRREQDVKPAQFVKNILVTVGGSDPENITLEIVKTIQPYIAGAGNVSVTVVIGKQYPYFSTLQEICSNTPGITIIRDPADMASVIASCDIAISGAGTTAWELAFMKIPMILVINGENQRKIADTLQSISAAFVIGGKEEVPDNLCPLLERFVKSVEIRQNFSDNASRLIDGHGADRVIMAILRQPFRLRKVMPDDCAKILLWANDEIVRKNAFQGEKITPEQHAVWFRHKQESENCYQYIAVDAAEQDIGQIRFDLTGGDAFVDISIDSAWRGRGFGTGMLILGTERLFRTSPAEAVHARVKADNPASIRTFENAGFTLIGSEDVCGCNTLHFIKKKTEQAVADIP
ncbi:MAG: UDP-2,4-diacetamido-2,4,6-trideoxy-beta-L-altropyranose hydrolase [Deltaproteobacteria bacterium]|nr:UDP-2,4-diacetamido-2,4,6-trideoxy-beta-L-altropyranose hydrolase [Deltaproteobacteria bacterium]